MSSNNNHKRSASPSGDRDPSLNKRQRRDEVVDVENQLDEKDEEKKEREVKEGDVNAKLFR
jgi:hypothetical protein